MTKPAVPPEVVRVTHFHRRPLQGAHSIERLYEDVRGALPPRFFVTVSINRWFSRGIMRRLGDAIRATWHQGDVNHVTGDVHYLTYFMHRARTVLTIHDCVALTTATGFRRWALWFFWFWLPLRRSAAIVVISETTKQELMAHTKCPESRIVVIHNSVSKEFAPCPRRFDAQVPRILHIGCTPNKNLERHAAALSAIACRLVVVGSMTPSQRQTLARHGIDYVSRSDLSRFQLLAEYQECDMLLFASTYEGFGLPIVEAQAVGRPVVTSNTSSMPEVAGDAAILVDPFDVESIRRGVLQVIHDADHRNDLVRRGFENAKRFQSEQVAQRYADLYDCIYANSRRTDGMRT